MDLDKLSKIELLEKCKKQRYMLGKLNGNMKDLEDQLEKLIEENRRLEQQIVQLKNK